MISEVISIVIFGMKVNLIKITQVITKFTSFSKGRSNMKVNSILLNRITPVLNEM